MEPYDFDRLWDYADPAKTERLFRDMLPAAIAGGDCSYHYQLFTQIARCEGLQGKFAEAHRTLDEVESQLVGLPAVVQVRYLLERGRALNSANERELACLRFREAWDVASQAGVNLENYAADAAHMLGIAAPGDEGLAWNERAVALAERSADPATRRWLGPLYNNLGWTYHDRGECERALALFEKALSVREQYPAIEPIRIAHWCIARCLRSLGRTAEALARQEQLLAEYEAAGGNSGYVWEELGECHHALGRPTEARRWFALAFAEFAKDAWLVEHEAPRLDRLRRLGGVD